MFRQYVLSLTDLLQQVEADEAGEKKDLSQAVAEVLCTLKMIHQDQTLFWVGNGGSAALAAHSALDYFRTANFRSMAFNDGPLLTCLSNDFGYPVVFEKPLERWAVAKDLLVAISSSGKSENILRAVNMAKRQGCRVITLSGFDRDNPLRLAGDINFYVPSHSYGQVELAHGVLCHGFLDLFMQNRKTSS
ncbi:MAG TPA: SIS domain-containing protein [Patescibacteria group bacterium]|nr:SIS domain-containing protein [Patescibacteria group bacterium]